MFSVLRSAAASRSCARAFSTSRPRFHDVSRLTLVGRLGKDPEVRISKTDKEYVVYTVATVNYPPPPANPDGTRPDAKVSWHHVLSFNPNANGFIKTLEKGARVYVEANYEIREPDLSSDPSSPQGQRQIYLKHETIRVVGSRPNKESRPVEEEEEEGVDQ